MGILFNRQKKKKFFRYDLFVNEGEGWKLFGDYVEYLKYEDIENPTPGAIIKLYGVYADKSKKEGFGRESVWEHEVPTPGGKAKGEAAKKEKPIEERFLEKIIESVDFTKMQPSKLSVPFGKTGGNLEFSAPTTGYGEMPPLEFEGKLPAWLHPAAAQVIEGFFDKFSGIAKTAISGAISEATGIKAKQPGSEKTVEKEGAVEKAPDMVSELDSILEEEVEPEIKNNKKEKKKEE
jgi:hypothetical protein